MAKQFKIELRDKLIRTVYAIVNYDCIKNNHIISQTDLTAVMRDVNKVSKIAVEDAKEYLGTVKKRKRGK